MGWNLRLEASHVNNHIPKTNFITGYAFGEHMFNGWDSDKVESSQDIRRAFKTGGEMRDKFHLSRPVAGGGYGFVDFNLNLFSLPESHKFFPEKLRIFMYEGDGQNHIGVATLHGLKLISQKMIDLDKALTIIGNKFLTAKQSRSYKHFTFAWDGKYELDI